MAASTMAASMVQTRVVSRAAAPAQRRSAVVVVRAEATEQVSRRAALGAVAGVLGALSLATGAAEAKTKVAYQESLGRGGSSTAASMSGYGMEGTKKRGISPAERKEFMRKFKEGVSAPPGIAETLKGK